MGKSVIDYILVDDNIFRCIQSVGYEPFNIHILSNHRGIFMDLSTFQCFGSAITPLIPRAIQDLSTKRSHQIAPYFDAKHQHLLNHKWYDKLAQIQKHLQGGTTDHSLAEDMYSRLIAESNFGGSQLKAFPPAPYSPTISCLRNIQRLLKLVVTQMKTDQDMTDNIARTKAKLGDAGYPLPQTIEQCQKALHGQRAN